MDLKINREMLTVSESIFDGIQEQSVELDYILPDYFPDIFKLVKCCIVPSVLSYSINGDTVSYELQADIKILYCSEQSNTLQCICQKMTFNKSIQLSETAEKPSVTLVPKTDHINCRVVNQRRIDMRGAVSIKIKITGERTQEVICDIFGMNAQMKKLPVEFAAKKISAFKSISASEDFELNSSNQPVISIIRTYSVINVTDKKIVANKLVLKGEASVCVLYSCENGLESMKFPVPFSQIVDMDGLDESFTCSVKAETLTEDYISSQAFMTMAIVDKYIIGLSPDKTINGVIKYWVNNVAGLNYSDQQIADAIARAMAHIGNIDVTDLTVSEAAIQVLREIDSLGFSETNLNRLEAAFSLMPYDLVTLEGPDGTAAQAFAETKNSLTYVVTGAYESGDVTMNGKVDLYDAIEIAKYMMGMVDFTNEQIAIGDMTGDGVCDLYDAIEVARTLM